VSSSLSHPEPISISKAKIKIAIFGCIGFKALLSLAHDLPHMLLLNEVTYILF